MSDETEQAAADQAQEQAAAQQAQAAQQAAAQQNTAQAAQAAQGSGAVTSPPAQNPNNWNPVPKNYNAQGALGGLFAPAYIPGYAPSEQAVQAWQAPRAGGGNLTAADLQSTAMPAPPSSARTAYGYYGQYGPNLAGGNTYTFGGQMVDPAALQAMAQDQPYNLAARRAQVAQAMAAQGQTPPTYPPLNQYGY